MLYHSILPGASVSSSVHVITSAPTKLHIGTTPVLFLHSITLLSNSFAFWKDQAVPFFPFLHSFPPVLTVL